MPLTRQRSATFRPASPSLTIAKICSSVNLLRFIGPPLKSEDPHSMRGGLLGAGHTSSQECSLGVLTSRRMRTPRSLAFLALVATAFLARAPLAAQRVNNLPADLA